MMRIFRLNEKEIFYTKDILSLKIGPPISPGYT
jgi:hypothetical protein